MKGQLRELHLFAGTGGGILGGMLLGHRPICAVEIEPYRRTCLLQRQRDGVFPWFPIWDDVRTFDGNPWRGKAEIVAGGFPCQDISAANSAGKGIDGERSGLWREMARVVREVGPQFVFVENSPNLTARGLGRVLGDLAKMGYDAEWGVFAASDAIFLECDPALYHDRDRIFILGHKVSDPKRAERRPASQQRLRDWEERANSLLKRKEAAARFGAVGSMDRKVSHAKGDGLENEWLPEEGRFVVANSARMGGSGEGADANGDAERGGAMPLRVGRIGFAEEIEGGLYGQGNQWAAEPGVGRMAYGVANRNDRLAAIGDSQVPAVVRLAWEILTNEI